jgi:hypothetical protein
METAVVVATPQPTLLQRAKSALSTMRTELYVASLFVFLFLSATAVGAQEGDPEPVVRPTLELDTNTMLFYMFEGANIIIVALGAVVFLTIGFVLGRKILELIRNAIQSL